MFVFVYVCLRKHMPACRLSQWPHSRVRCKENGAVNITGFYFEFPTECSSLQQASGLCHAHQPRIGAFWAVNAEIKVTSVTHAYVHVHVANICNVSAFYPLEGIAATS